MRHLPVFVALILLPASLAPSAAANGRETNEPGSASGALLFRIHCQNCHGKTAKGDGPMARLLTVQPSDLTAIARQNDGEFPAETVRNAIDGRTEVRAHGIREMPVWGISLRESGRDSSQQEEIRARINDLVEYLRAIQE